MPHATEVTWGCWARAKTFKGEDHRIEKTLDGTMRVGYNDGTSNRFNGMVKSCAAGNCPFPKSKKNRWPSHGLRLSFIMRRKLYNDPRNDSKSC